MAKSNSPKAPRWLSFLVALILFFVLAHVSPAEASLVEVTFGKRDWIDEGLDILTGNRGNFIGASVSLGGEEYGAGMSAPYTPEQRFAFVAGLVAITLFVGLLLVCCFCCLCSDRSSPPPVIIAPAAVHRSQNYVV